MLEGDVMTSARQREDARNELKKDIEESLSPAFPLVVTAEDLHQSLSTLIQSFGVGPLKANMAIFNWSGTLRKGILEIRRNRLCQQYQSDLSFGM